MADLSKIVCLEQDCRHGTEQAGSSGSGNDTYTKAEIDSKDADIRAAASEAKSAANNAQSVNQTQDGQIKVLQEAVDNLHNYEHPTHKANSKGFYKFASDDLGHVSETEAVTKNDIVGLGIPGHYYRFGRNEKAEWYQDQNNELLVTKIDGANETTEKIPIAPSAQMCKGFDSHYAYFMVANERYCISEHTWYDPAGCDVVTYVRINGKHYGPNGYAYNAAIESDIAIVAPKFEGKFLGTNATTEEQGLMSAADKKKLDGMDLSKYLPLAGGVMTGDIDMQTNKRDILVGTQKANTSDGTPVAGGIIEARANMTSTLPKLRSFVGMFHNADINRYYDVISVRHRNGYNDGNLYGMYIFSESTTASADLKWGKQTKGTGWTSDFTLLDSRNYTNYALPKDGTAKKAELLSSGQMRTAYCHNDDATFSNGYVWFKIGTATLSGAYSTVTTTFLGVFGYGRHVLYTCRVRVTSAGNTVENITFFESGKASSNIPSGMFRVVAINGEKNVTFELWAKGASRWEGTRVVILNEMNLAGGNQSNFWTLTSRGNADAKTAPTSGNMYADSIDKSLCATAAKATEATALTETAWAAVPATGADSTSERDLKYLVMGNTVYVQGYLKFSAGNNNPKCGTLPGGARPNDTLYFTGWDTQSGVPTAFPIVVNEAGIIMLMNPTSTAYWFKAGRAYRFNFSYHIN